MSTTATTPVKIEYGEQHVKPNEELEVYAPSADHVRVLDVTPVGDDLRFRYVVIWENGENR